VVQQRKIQKPQPIEAELEVKASAEVEKAVAVELKREDPPVEQAKALLEGDEDDKSEGA